MFLQKSLLNNSLFCLITLFFISCTTQNPESSVKSVIIETAKQCGEHHNTALAMAYDNIVEGRSQGAHSLPDMELYSAKAIKDISIDLGKPLIGDPADIFTQNLNSLKAYEDKEIRNLKLSDDISSISIDNIFIPEVSANLSALQKKYLNEIYTCVLDSEDLEDCEKKLDQVIVEATEELPINELQVVLEAAYIGKASAQYWSDNLAEWESAFEGNELSDSQKLEELSSLRTTGFYHGTSYNRYYNSSSYQLMNRYQNRKLLTVPQNKLVARRLWGKIGITVAADIGGGIIGAWGGPVGAVVFGGAMSLMAGSILAMVCYE